MGIKMIIGIASAQIKEAIEIEMEWKQESEWEWEYFYLFLYGSLI